MNMMKLRYFIPTVVAVAAMFTGCSSDDDARYLDNIQVSTSYVSLNKDGGNTSVTLTTSADWSIVESTVPAWLTISPMSGSAGETKLNFTAEAYAGRQAVVKVNCGGQTQEINIIQGVAEVSVATCKQVLEGPDSKTYRVTGTVTGIANTTYGNWYMDDGTGEIYIYGTLDKNGRDGQNNSIAAWGIEIGDEITVEGPKTTYNGTVELVNVTVLKVNKSLIKVDSLSSDAALPLEGGDVTAFVTCKGDGIGVEIPADAADWLFISAVTANSVTFRALPNAGGDRSTTVTFTTKSGSKSYTSQTTISQKGAILEVPVADFLAAEVGDTQFRITGIITELYASDKQGKSFYLQDYSGKMLVYRAEGFIELGAKVGDVVTVVGKRGAYKDSPQMVSGTVEMIAYSVETVTIAQFREKADSKDTYYMISGIVSEATEDGTKNDLETYGNFNLTDETGSVYIYGVTEGWGGKKGTFGNLGVALGDRLTIVAYKTSYKGLVEGVGMFFSNQKTGE